MINKFNLILIRHGESVWNKLNKFTGWKNIPLTNKGIYQAINIAKLLKNKKIKIDYIFTSELDRAIKTAKIINFKMDLNKNINCNWRLNERSYGSLEGKSRIYVKNNFYEEYLLFKNNIHAKPLISIYPDVYNRSESIVNTAERFKPLWKNKILPLLKKNKTVLIVSHKNQIKSILYILNMDPKIDIPNCDPIMIKITK